MVGVEFDGCISGIRKVDSIRKTLMEEASRDGYRWWETRYL